MGVARTTTELVEHIRHDGASLACIVRAGLQPDSTRFVTAEDWTQQVGFVVYPAGGEIVRHVHRRIRRNIVGTSEVLIVRRGRCEIDLFGDDGAPVATRELCTGDIAIILAGGHGFRMLEDTVFLEVKQGPYTGIDEKEYF
jgi:uncharacterized protein YjlB